MSVEERGVDVEARTTAQDCPGVTARVGGWGRYPYAETCLIRPEKLEDVARALDGGPSAIARGLARSYGDPAFNPQGLTVLTERLNRLLAFDAATGELRCEAGVTLDALIRVFLPRGWFLPVTPGTKFVTVGGAVAADVHGKNHHRDGSFSRFVRSLTVRLASGALVTCSREHDPDLFWATLGGMGLTGIVTEATFTLRPVETSYVRMHSIRARNLDDAIALFDTYEPQYPYTMAWIDCLASGASLGRSILMMGDHARVDDLPPRRRADPLALRSGPRLRVPFDMPAGLLNGFTMRAFNTLYYRRHTAREAHSIVDYDTFFYPLDVLLDWNRMYGRKGFVQYQCVVPLDGGREALVEILRRCSQAGRGSFLAVLKRFGEQEGLLSFPMPGYTLTLDLPVKKGLHAFLDTLDEQVLRYNGRIYLAKDAHMSPASFRAMYPAYPDWQRVKARVDPDNRFTSALAQRLQIGPS